MGPPTAAETQDSTQTRRHLQSDMGAFGDSAAAVRPAGGIGFEEAGSGLGARRSLADVSAADAIFVLFSFDFSDVGARTAYYGSGLLWVSHAGKRTLCAPSGQSFC